MTDLREILAAAICASDVRDPYGRITYYGQADAVLAVLAAAELLVIPRGLAVALRNDLNTLDGMLKDGDVGVLFSQEFWPAAREYVVLMKEEK